MIDGSWEKDDFDVSWRFFQKEILKFLFHTFLTTSRHFTQKEVYIGSESRVWTQTQAQK